MGKLKSYSRHLDPLCVWRAKQKEARDKAIDEDIKKKLRESAAAVVEEAKKLEK